MQNWINRAVNSQKFSVITSENSANKTYIRTQCKKQIRIVVYLHSYLYQTGKSQLEIGVSSQEFRYRPYLPLLRAMNKKLCRNSQKLSSVLYLVRDCYGFENIEQVTDKIN
ncbi:hypothetical protein [Microcystis aeruginosa]|uniref:hypothetical protein n=1 Tax=Microcystis aeruginosa TaxID=1126 RepID=UPI0021AB6F55|nr:hypothetical protein [Microcystis aeruginosa]